jgi:V/A-type H+-transporting ATPase subunit A
LQEADRLLMRTTAGIRQAFLAQNAFTEDAFSTPQQTYQKIRQLLDEHKASSERLEHGESSGTVPEVPGQ